LSSIPKGEKKHIVFAGKRNAGKSSLVNAILGQELSIVSEAPGTTTDPVKKTIELLPYGPVVLVDTAGIDDVGDLGEKRINKTLKALSTADFAVIVLEADKPFTPAEKKLFQYLEQFSLPYLIAVNKIEFGVSPILLSEIRKLGVKHYEVSCVENIGIDLLKYGIMRLLPKDFAPPLVMDLVRPGEIIVLVVPIDHGAPKGRLILPQVQTIREALDADTIVIVAKDTELRSVLSSLKYPPKLIVTDSQAIMRIASEIPESIMVTTFSILMARHKGDLGAFVQGLKRIDELKDGDKILIAEACTHHAQKDDIGRIKIPRWLHSYTKKNLDIEVASGLDFPEDIAEYKLIIQCGGCMLTRKSLCSRIRQAQLVEVPIVNYGMIISYMHGAMPRVIAPFEDAMVQWNKFSKAM
jgi:[FeFe] hydrogenase H-cluster maturation GTPase HydF